MPDKVYCKSCLNYGENYEDGYSDWCTKADKLEIKIKGTYRDPPRIHNTVVAPETKNKNNNCSDYNRKVWK